MPKRRKPITAAQVAKAEVHEAHVLITGVGFSFGHQIYDLLVLRRQSEVISAFLAA